MRSQRLIMLALVLWAAPLNPSGAAPAGNRPAVAPIEGVVVKVAEGEVVIDLGSARGVPPEGRIELYRRMVVEHPITKKTIEDRFPIGAVVPAQVGSLLSIIRDVEGLQRPPVPGDFAVYRPPVTLAPPKPVEPARGPAREARPVARAPDAAALDATFAESLGRSLPDRIALYEAWLAAFPESDLRPGVGAELAALRTLLNQVREGQAAPPPEPEDSDGLTVRHQPLRPVIVGERVEVAIALIETDRAEQVRLLSARDPDETWTVQRMVADGDYYFRAALPPDQLGRPGEVRYVVEVVRPDGRLVPVVGESGSPEVLSVQPRPPGDDPPGDSHLEVLARQVDFNTVGEAVDRYFHFEAAYSYALNWHSLRAVRVGVGVIDGEGGPTESIDTGGETRSVLLNYAFGELEIELSQWVGLAARLTGGNHQSGDDDPRSAMVGSEFRLRLGRFDETRFVAGISVLDVLGVQGFLDARIEVFERLPMRLGVVVTNLPVDADLGVQIEYSVGYRVFDWLTLMAQTGWNARTINHYGFTGGGGLALDW